MNGCVFLGNIVARLQLPRMEGCVISEGDSPPSVAAYVPVVKVSIILDWTPVFIDKDKDGSLLLRFSDSIGYK